MRPTTSMKRPRTSLALLVIALLVTSAAPTTSASAGTSGAIAGTVTGPGGVPVAAVVVEVYTEEFFFDTTSGADGSYLMAGLLPGTYTVAFYPPGQSGLSGEIYDDTGFWEDPTPVVVTAGVTTTVDAELEEIDEEAFIEGELELPAGTPTSEAVVVIALGFDGIGFAFVQPDGSYRIDGLVTGDYYLGSATNEDSGLVDEFYDAAEMPSGADAVSVVGGETTSGIDFSLRRCTADFTDIASKSRFCIAIEWLDDTGLGQGFADGTFRPTLPVTRAAAAAFLWRRAGAPVGPFVAPEFSDVPADHPFFTAIAWMASEGITAGFDDGTFRPNAEVTRQAASAFLWRAAGSPPPEAVNDDECVFVDVCDGHPFAEPIAWMYWLGVAGGFPEGDFKPTRAVTRQAMASFLYEYQYQTEQDALTESFIHEP